MTTNILLQTTESLISAIQAEDVAAFRTLVQSITTAGLAAGAYPGLWLNGQLPGSGITALHVAARLYSINYKDPVRSKKFNEMVEILLSNGASPALAMGKKYRKGTLGPNRIIVTDDPGKTVAEVCDKKLPPSLAAWFAALKCDVRLNRDHDIYASHAGSRLDKLFKFVDSVERV
ncbi:MULTISPECIES: hypothetical protein [Stenotrophomonas]|uniref:hypothetical protein n=1 Tax=Stenotrophomonas maltophilia TaxID=40324 RepID=UPI00115F8D17|nr:MULTISPECIES: hypothetical protein [Stenotrophomonas]